jgi:outer membrane protein assembly factor BamB
MQKNKVMMFVFLHVLLVQTGVAQLPNVPKIKWKFQSLSPIRGGISMQGNFLFFGNAEGIMHSLNKNTNTLQWTFKANGAIVCTPAIGNGQVLFSSRDNHVYSLDASTGKLKWRFNTDPETPHKWGWDYYMASPVVAGKIVFAGSGDHNLYALNADNGKLLWKFKTGNKIRATPLLHQGKLYLPSFDGIVYVLDAANGNLLWKFETEGAHLNSDNFGWDRNSINATPAIQDSLMVFGSRDGSIYCVNINTHREKWKFTYGPTWSIASPLIRNGAVLTSWSDNSLFCSIDLLSGKERWKYDCGSFVYPNPTTDDQNVYTGAGNGKVFAFNYTTGALQWQYQTSGPVLSSPLMDQGVVYIGSDDGNLYAFQKKQQVFRAVYMPEHFKSAFVAQLKVDGNIAPYFISKGYEKLDSASLLQFMSTRIKDGLQSVIVFAHDYLPPNITGEDPAKSLFRKYMESGGKVIRPGFPPNFYKADASGKFIGQDLSYGEKLLDVKIDVPFEGGNYFASATRDGLNWGLPEKLTATNPYVANEGLVILAINELGRPGIWYKKIGDKPSGGYVSCRTWGWGASAQQKDLDLLFALAEYGL